MIFKHYISPKNTLRFLEKCGYKTLTVRKLLYNLGVSVKSVKEKAPKHLLNKRYAWKTKEQYNIITKGLTYWWLDIRNYIDPEDYSTTNSEDRIRHYEVNYVTERLLKEFICNKL